jgi:hypothetical protein
MKAPIYAVMLAGALGGGASAADLPAGEPGRPEPSRPSCFDSFWDYLKSSVKDCPLSTGPFTLYGNIDLGYGYSESEAPVGSSAEEWVWEREPARL